MFEYSMAILTPQKKLTAHFLVQLSIATLVFFSALERAEFNKSFSSVNRFESTGDF